MVRLSRRLPPGQLWRHNEAGDLAGEGSYLNVAALQQLVAANRGHRGFTFTHKTAERNWLAIADANRDGFTVNLSADTLSDADDLAEIGAGPVVVLLPHDASGRLRTPAGRPVVVCPAQTHGLTCMQCQLCAKPWRKAIVGFRAHGQFQRHVPELVELRRKRS